MQQFENLFLGYTKDTFSKIPLLGD